MKNWIFRVFSLLAIGVLLLAGCEKNPPPQKQDPCPYPEITTEGLNTFGCKINGVEWVPCVDLFGQVVGLTPFDCRVSEHPDSNILSVSVLRNVKDSTYSTLGSDISLSFRIEPIKTGRLDIINDLSFSEFRFRNIETNSSEYNLIDSTETNFIEIKKLNLDSNIISGTIQVVLINKETQENVHITDGRFDFTYIPQ